MTNNEKRFVKFYYPQFEVTCILTRPFCIQDRRLILSFFRFAEDCFHYFFFFQSKMKKN